MWRITRLIINAIKEIREFNRLNKELLESQNELNQYDRERLEELTRQENEWLSERARLYKESFAQWQESRNESEALRERIEQLQTEKWNESEALHKQIGKLRNKNFDLSTELKKIKGLHTREMEQYLGLRQDLLNASKSKQIADFQVISVIKIAERIGYDSDFIVYFFEKGKLGTMEIVLRAGASRNGLMKSIADCRTREEVLKHDQHENIYYD